MNNKCEIAYTASRGDNMGKQKHSHTSAVKHPLPVQRISKNAPHGKGHFDLIQDDDLPVEVLEKEIPASDLHDM